jgi:small subunit ribosomal protein S1
MCSSSYVHGPGFTPRDLANSMASTDAVRLGVSMRMPTISKPGTLTRDERLTSRYGGGLFEPDGGWGELTAADTFSYEDMAASMQEIVKYSRGDRCKGVILGYEPNGALVDIGAKSSAYCALSEAALTKPDKVEVVFEIGVEYEFSINSREDENGQLMLSRRRILTEAAWEAVNKIMAEDSVVEATVNAVNRGGAMLSIHGLRAFLPGSHYLPGQNPPESLVGTPLAVKLLDVDQENNRLVCSHRKAMVDQTINNLAVGSVLRGIITAVKPYGAFVDVGGMSGLLHISQISCDHIADVGAILPLGTVIKCMVISQDKSKGRVALSTKTLESEPGDMLKNPDKVFEEAEATAAKYQERLEAERKAREEAAQDVIFGLESVFSDSDAEVPLTTSTNTD